MPMTRERFEYLHRNHDAKLTAEELAEGYFFCCTWDGLLIHKTGPEAECCGCLKDATVGGGGAK